ncbi:alpha/beta fold hydrolase [Faunimonas sp. B44]
MLRYERLGKGPRTILLLHEMGGTLESWDYVVDLLAESYGVVRFDMRCTGLSEWKPGPVTIEDLSGDALALLDALGGTGPVAIAGCAVGAAVAIHFAAAFPARTAALVAMSPAIGLPEEAKAAALTRAARLEAGGVRPTVDEQLDRSYPPALRQDRSRFAEVRSRRLAANPFGAAAFGRMLAGLDLSAALSRVKCPTLVLAGRHDHVRPIAGVAETARRIAGAQMEVLETGHFMPLQTPEPVAAALLRFLDARWP